jgi:DNA-binding response OmpR family regulator
MLPRTSFAFDRQRIVVAGEDSVTIAFAIATLRRDGHCVTHVADAGSGSWDFALRECHLLIAASSLGSVAGAAFLQELRERRPALSILYLAGQPSESAFPTLREPFTAEELLVAVRPLLPHLRSGSVLARDARTPQAL